jgi:VanZ family protein
MKTIKVLIKFWLPPIVWAFLIFLYSSKSVPVTTQVFWQDFTLKKTAHLIEYAILTILIFRGLTNSGVGRKKAAVISILISCVYGASDEFHQSFVPGRQSRVRDVVFDTIGASLGILILWNILPKVPKRLQNWAAKLDLI